MSAPLSFLIPSMRRASIYRLAGLLVAILIIAPMTGDAFARQQAQQRPQQRVVAPEARTGMTPELRSRIATVDTTLTPRSRVMRGGRIDAETGVVRARYRVDANVDTARHGADDPLRFVRPFADELGIADPETELVLEDDVVLPRSRHLTFRQVLDGVPVFGAYVRINIDPDGHPSMVLNGFQQLTGRDRPAPAIIDQNAAIREVANHAGQSIIILGQPERVIYPTDPLRSAWYIIARSETGPEEWSVLIDATNGEVLAWIDQRTHAHRIDSDIRTLHAYPPANASSNDVEAVAFITGSGSVFDPDPLTTAGAEYGPPFVDADDADIPELNDQRIEVPLFDITLDSDGQYRLSGPYVDIVGDATVGGYRPPSLNDAHGFHFTRGHEHFEAVNAYHHIHQSQRYVQSAVPEMGIHDFPVRVNPRAWSADNSTYTPGADPRVDGFIRFGTGGIDDAEDAHVILHEYAHALLEVSARSLRGTLEGQALHEGWADYWAVSYTRELIESGVVPPRDWRKVFTWDGNETWSGRFLGHTGTYPEDASCTRGACNIYNDGTLWATALMEVYDVLGRHVTDRLNLLSHLYLIPPVTMQDAAEAIIQADSDYFDGEHLSVLLEVFGRRGFIQPAAFAPIVRHEPPPSTERTTGTLTFTAFVSGDTPPEAVYFVRLDGAAVEARTAFVHQADSIFIADIPLSADAPLIRYYIEAVGTADAVTRSPPNAPAEFFTVETGPDIVPPIISHEPPPAVSHLAWPVSINVFAEDRMGIDTVWVDFEGAGHNGAFGLSHDDAGWFSGSFPGFGVDPGDVFAYHVHALDRAEAANVATAGPFTIDVVSNVVLRRFTFEGEHDGGVAASGAWQLGAPDTGTRFAWEGDVAWSVAAPRTTVDAVETSSLILPDVRSHALDDVYLVFHHWYGIVGETPPPSFPHATPSVTSGGNVWYSTDGGLTWRLAVPEGGYPTSFLVSGAEPDGPSRGMPVFGGHSYGWQREIVPLPAADSIRVRFDFTSHSASKLPAQLWYIDDVSLVAERPLNDDAPDIIATPPDKIAVGAGESGPWVTVEAWDNGGIAAVLLPYVLEDGDRHTVQEGTLRLTMSDTSATHFRGVFEPEDVSRAGWRATYSIVVRDFDGNEAVRGTDGAPYVVEYVHNERRDLLAGLRTTGAWWRAADRFRVDGAEALGRTSSLLTDPIDLPSDVTSLRLGLEHVLNVDDGLGGNVKISTDGGASWLILTPDGGYSGVFNGDHRMAGEAVFAGAHGDRRRETFDLTAYQGAQIQLRIDFGAVRPIRPSEHWVVHAFALDVTAPTEEIETPRQWQLHANYPNPFGSSTTISWTVAEPAAVSIEIFDPLGRRVDVISSGVLPPQTYTVTYDGSRLASGVYFVRMTADDVVQTRPIVVAR